MLHGVAARRVNWPNAQGPDVTTGTREGEDPATDADDDTRQHDGNLEGILSVAGC